MIINVPTKAMSQWQTVLRVLPTRWRQKSSCTDIWIEITSLSPYVHRWTSSDSNRGAHKSRLVLIQSWFKTWIRLAISQTPDMELGHILWPSDPVTRESSDLETQLTRWPCSIMNSKCRLMLQTNVCNGQEVCQFLSLFGVCTLLKSKILKIIY